MYFCKQHPDERFNRIPIGAVLVPMYGHASGNVKTYRFFDKSVHDLFFAEEQCQEPTKTTEEPQEFVGTVTFFNNRRGMVESNGVSHSFIASEIKTAEKIKQRDVIRFSVKNGYAVNITKEQL